MTGIRRRVLIVEDDQLTNKALSVLIRALGHECTSVSDGEEALRAAEQTSPEIALVDLRLPGRINGYEVARQLRASQTTPLFLAAITGWEPAYDPTVAFEAGFDRHVVKPPPLDLIQSLLADAETMLG